MPARGRDRSPADPPPVPLRLHPRSREIRRRRPRRETGRPRKAPAPCRRPQAAQNVPGISRKPSTRSRRRKSPPTPLPIPHRCRSPKGTGSRGAMRRRGCPPPARSRFPVPPAAGTRAAARPPPAETPVRLPPGKDRRRIGRGRGSPRRALPREAGERPGVSPWSADRRLRPATSGPTTRRTVLPPCRLAFPRRRFGWKTAKEPPLRLPLRLLPRLRRLPPRSSSRCP